MGNFNKGAILGGLLGGLAGLFAAPKSGREFRDQLNEGYQTVNRKRDHLIHLLKGEKCEDCEDCNCCEECECNPCECESDHSFLIGTAIGAVIGIVSALLLAPSSGKKLREDLGDTYDEVIGKAEHFLDDVERRGHKAYEQVEDWKDTLSNIVEKTSKSKRRGHSSNLDQILDYAKMGLRIWNEIEKRR